MALACLFEHLKCRIQLLPNLSLMTIMSIGSNNQGELQLPSWYKPLGSICIPVYRLDLHILVSLFPTGERAV